jgi:hypothetical protein
MVFCSFLCLSGPLLYNPMFMDGSCYELGLQGPAVELIGILVLLATSILCWYSEEDQLDARPLPPMGFLLRHQADMMPLVPAYMLLITCIHPCLLCHSIILVW